MGQQTPQAQRISIPLTNAVQLKVGDRGRPIGTMKQLTNVVMTNPGTIEKRRGWVALPQQIEGQAKQLTSAQSISAANDELLLFDGSHGYSWSPSTQTWFDKGVITSTQITDDQVHHGAAANACPDIAVLGNLQLTTWLDAVNGLCYSISDTSTGAYAQANVQLDAQALWARCCVLGGKLTVIWAQYQYVAAGGAGTFPGIQLGDIFCAVVNEPTDVLIDQITQLYAQPGNQGYLQGFFNAQIAFKLNIGLDRVYLAWTFKDRSIGVSFQGAYVDASLALHLSTRLLVDAPQPDYEQNSAVCGIGFDAADNAFFYANELVTFPNQKVVSYVYGFDASLQTYHGVVQFADTPSLKPWFLQSVTSAPVACLPANATAFIDDPTGTSVTFLASWLTAPVFQTPSEQLTFVDQLIAQQNNALAVNGSPGSVAASYPPQLNLNDSAIQFNGLYPTTRLNGDPLDPVGQVTYQFNVNVDMIVSATVAPVHQGWQRGVQLCGDAFQQAGQWYAPCAHYSTLQPTLFVINVDSLDIVAVDRPQTLGGIWQLPGLVQQNPAFTVGSQGQPSIAQPFSGVSLDLQLAVQDSVAPPGVGTMQLDFNPDNSYDQVTIDQSTFIIGAHGLKTYYGADFAEQGFYLYPERPLVVPVTTPGGTLASTPGTWLYNIVYAATDNNGLVTRSAPFEVPLQVSGSAIPISGSFNAGLLLPLCQLTDRDPTQVTIEVYRTVQNGAAALSYLVAQVPNVCNITSTDFSQGFNPPAGFPSANYWIADAAQNVYGSQATWPLGFVSGVYGTQLISASLNAFDAQDYVAYLDALPDAAITQNLQLYTNGGTTAPYMPAPPCSIIQSFLSRLFVAGVPNDPYGLYFSNVSQGDNASNAINFNSLNRIELDSQGGAITALGVVNNQLMIFKERAIFALNGQGPGANGGVNDGGSAYPQPYLLVSDVGCVGQQTVQLISNLASGLGLSFMSERGLYTTDGSSQVNPFGAPIEPFVLGALARNVTSAVLIPDEFVVRYTLSSDDQLATPGSWRPGTPNQQPMLTFNYLVNQWVPFTGLDAASSCLWQDFHVIAKADGKVWYESPQEAEYYQDPYGTYSVLLETNNISAFGPYAVHRIHSIFFGGEYKAPHFTDVYLTFDNAAGPNFYKRFDSTALFTGQRNADPPGPGTYGWGDTYDPSSGAQPFGIPTPFGMFSPFGIDPTVTLPSGSVYGTTTTGSIPFNATYGAPWFDYVFDVTPDRKCYSIRIAVELIDSGSGGSGATLSDIVAMATDQQRGPALPTGQRG
jgi:hypothetical protein